jgi:hypothetical protein
MLPGKVHPILTRVLIFLPTHYLKANMKRVMFLHRLPKGISIMKMRLLSSDEQGYSLALDPQQKGLVDLSFSQHLVIIKTQISINIKI